MVFKAQHIFSDIQATTKKYQQWDKLNFMTNNMLIIYHADTRQRRRYYKFSFSH